MGVNKISQAILEFVKAQVPEEDILINEPMKKHTTFRIGGEAECLVRISKWQQLSILIPYLQKVEAPYFILGNGSNLLISDQGYKGIVLQLSNRLNALSYEGNCIVAEAGALMSQVAAFAMEHSLTGLEFASGIPGTIGGGVVMNAGAYGGEMQQIIESVTVMNNEGEILELSNDTMEFGYRTSIIKSRPFIVLAVKLRLQPGNREEILAKMSELASRRKEKQPLEYASAGSTFKRPEGNFAGKLIMDAGLRGYSVGGARVSEKHCGFVINAGNATASDVAEVIREVQDRVKDKFGISLETEVIFLGEF